MKARTLVRATVVALVAMTLALPVSDTAAALPTVEVKKLTASDAEDEDWFGFSVSVSGDAAIVGAWAEDGAGSGDARRGAAYVFGRDRGGAHNWGEVKKLTASDAQDWDYFGWSVGVDGETVIVGAYQASATAYGQGAAYLFGRDVGGADNWGQVIELTASDPQDYDYFGEAVALSGDTAIVGAIYEDGAGGANADRGAAYVFERDRGGADNWGQVKKLTASDPQDGDYFGCSVAVSGDTAIVGAYSEDGTGGANANRGAAYVFDRNQGGANNWGEVKKLSASDADDADHFGGSVALSGDTAIVGAQWEDGAGGALADRGAAYAFDRDQGGADSWGEVKKLTASDAQDGDFFGWSVALGGDAAIVGARGEDGAGGANANRGAAYTFQRDEGGADNWGEVKKLSASDAANSDAFGFSVAITGDTGVVGAIYEDGTGQDRGAAYVFGPAPVGGIAELPDADAAPLETGGSPGTGVGVLAGIAAALAAGTVVLGGAAWYARRRRGGDRNHL